MNNMFSNYLFWQINTELDSLFAFALNFTSQRKHVYRIENISCNILVKISPTIFVSINNPVSWKRQLIIVDTIHILRKTRTRVVSSYLDYFTNVLYPYRTLLSGVKQHEKVTHPFNWLHDLWRISLRIKRSCRITKISCESPVTIMTLQFHQKPISLYNLLLPRNYPNFGFPGNK